MKALTLVVFLFLVVLVLPSQASTIAWDHDCLNTTGFRLYHENEQIADMLCPETTYTMDDMPDGSLWVTAYNDFGESQKSNTVLLLAAYYYNSIRYEYNASGMVIFKGEHIDWNADIADSDWVVTKYYYDGWMVIWTQTRIMTWVNRNLGW